MIIYCFLALFELTGGPEYYEPCSESIYVASSVLENVFKRINGENGWYVPQEDDSLIWMDRAEGESKLSDFQNRVYSKNNSSVTFHLFTRLNPWEGAVITQSADSLTASRFNEAHPTRFIIHGWRSSASDVMNEIIRDAWLSLGDFNVISVDWERARSLNYIHVAGAVPDVGMEIANMIDFLHNCHNMSLDNLYLIGHSLGAHVAGYAGKHTQSGKVHAIIGLDPALPLFSYDEPDKRLSSDDAVYVESIHTNGGQLGFRRPIGKGAFYPNGGISQPGCERDYAGACAHRRSFVYYVEAIRENDFSAWKCEDYREAMAKSCAAYSTVRMGATTNSLKVDGIFYVPVHSKYPFSLGL